MLAPKLPGHPFVQVEADTIEEAVRKAKAKAGDDKLAHKPNELYAVDVNFAAWNSMDKATRVKCVEDVGYPTGFAKQWAERDFTKLPADIKAGLLQNGYFKNFVAEQVPVQFGGHAEHEWNHMPAKELARELKDMGESELAELAQNLKGWYDLTPEQKKRFIKAFGGGSKGFAAAQAPVKFASNAEHEWNNTPAKELARELNAMGETELAALAQNLKGWYELTPEQKKRFIKAFGNGSKGFAAGQAPAQFGNAAENYADNRRRDSEAQVKAAYHKIQDKRGTPLDSAEMASTISDVTGLPANIVKQALQKLNLFSANFAAFNDLTKLASDLLKSGAAESDVRNALKAQGCTDENQQREVLAAARSYESKETFAAGSAESFWRGMNEEARTDFLSEVLGMLRLNARALAREYWSQLPDAIKAEISASYKDAHAFSANSDTMKPGGKFSAKFGKAEDRAYGVAVDASENAARLRGKHVQVIKWDVPNVQVETDDGVKYWMPRAALEPTGKEGGGYTIKDTYAAMGASLNGPGLKQDVVNAVLTNPARFGAGDKAIIATYLDFLDDGRTPEQALAATALDMDMDVDDVKDVLLSHNKLRYTAEKPVLLGDVGKPKPTDSGQPGSEQLPQKPKFIAEPDRKKASPAGDRWKDSMDKGILEAYDNAGGGEAGLKAVVASGLEPNVERAKSIVERLQKERHGGFAAKFTATLPTDDPSKPEVKQFGSIVEAVNYLAEHGFVNDRSRAAIRVEATGKWSAPSGAKVERFAAADEENTAWQYDLSTPGMKENRERALRHAKQDSKWATVEWEKIPSTVRKAVNSLPIGYDDAETR